MVEIMILQTHDMEAFDCTTWMVTYRACWQLATYIWQLSMWNNNHKPVSWYLISQRSTCPNPLLFVTFSLQLDSDGNGSDQNISEYSYGLFAYLKCRPVDLSNLIESSLVNLSIYLPIYIFFNASLNIYLSIHPSIHPSIYLIYRSI